MTQDRLFDNLDSDQYPVDSTTPDVRDLPDNYWIRAVHVVETGGKT